MSFIPAIICWITILHFFHKKSSSVVDNLLASLNSCQYPSSTAGCPPGRKKERKKDCFYLITQKSSTWGDYSREDSHISCYFVIKAYVVEYRTTHFYCLIYNFKVRTFYCIEDYNGIPLPFWAKQFWKLHWFYSKWSKYSQLDLVA